MIPILWSWSKNAKDFFFFHQRPILFSWWALGYACASRLLPYPPQVWGIGRQLYCLPGTAYWWFSQIPKGIQEHVETFFLWQMFFVGDAVWCSLSPIVLAMGVLPVPGPPQTGLIRGLMLSPLESLKGPSIFPWSFLSFHVQSWNRN